MAQRFCGFPRSCDLQKAISKSEKSLGSQIFLSSLARPVHSQILHLLALPWRQVQNLAGNAVTDTLSSRIWGLYCHCNVDEEVTSGKPALAVSPFFQGLYPLQSRQWGRPTPAREPRNTEGSQMTAPLIKNKIEPGICY